MKIPSGWEYSELETIVNAKIKYSFVDGPFGSNLKTIHYRKKGIPIITSGYVTSCRFKADSYIYVDPEKFNQEKRSAVQGGDIVMAKIGANCGACAILPKDHAEGILSGNALKIKVDELRHSTKYIWFNLVHLYRIGRLHLLRGEGAQPAISMAQLKKFKILLPPQIEQIKIAQILSTWDKAIEKTEQLIQTKIQLTSGLMQQLLTEKKRIIGFYQDWNEVKLGSICNISKGEQFNKLMLDKNGKYPSYSGGMVPSGYTYKWNTEANTIIISEGGNSCGYVNYIKSRFWSGGHCYALLSIKSHISKNYLYQYLKYHEPQIMRLRVGSGLPNVQKKDIAVFKIKFPHLKEQEAIANILDHADFELKLLMKYHYHLIDQKNGLLQKLLTGEVRVNTNKN